MSRVAEIIFSVIGLVIYGLVFFFSFRVLTMQEDTKAQFKQQMQDAMNSNPNAQGNSVSVDKIIDAISTGSLVIVIFSAIAIILGIVAIVFLKGNKKPKAAGIILIVTGVVTTLGTIAFGIFGGIAYLIAGITALVRKSKNKSITEESSVENY